MTVFDRIQNMTRDELQKLIYYIYLWGHLNEQCGVDDMRFYQQFLDMPSNRVDYIICELDNIKPVSILVTPLDGSGQHYLNNIFLSADDAVAYITTWLANIKIDDETYADTTAVYKIMPCGQWGRR